MRFKITLGTLAAALVAGAAFSQTPTGTPPPGGAGAQPSRPGEGLRRADTNQDGKVSFDEMKAVRPQITQERFNLLDRDHDGFISPKDGPEGGARGEGDPEARRQMMQTLMATDANHDGKVSFDEVTAAKPGFAKADFDRVDRDQDGFLTAQDAPHPPQAGERPRQPGGRGARGGEVLTPEVRQAIRERLRGADKDGDGFISRVEAKEAMPSLTDERFNAMDRNGDGKIGPGDRPERPGPAKGGTPPPANP
jgi:Ca2+-binding EF-hand superfamily protein